VLDETANDGCFLRLRTLSTIPVQAFSANRTPPDCSGSYSSFFAYFTRSLASIGANKYINLSDVSVAQQTWKEAFGANEFCSVLVFGDGFYFLFGNITEAQFKARNPTLSRKFVNASTTMNWVVDGTTYSQQGSVGGVFVSSLSMQLNDLVGSAIFTMTFTPSAP
jgi:hypothetical protein